MDESGKGTPAHDDAACGDELLWWKPATNEDGWRCAECGCAAGGEPPGYRPDLDRSHIESKVDAVLMAMHEAEVVYVSNGDTGAHITGRVAARCRELGLYDQYTIARLVIETMGSHAEFWKAIGDGVLSGSDPRERCQCGALSKVSIIGGGNYCMEHRPRLGAEPAAEAPA